MPDEASKSKWKTDLLWWFEEEGEMGPRHKFVFRNSIFGKLYKSPGKLARRSSRKRAKLKSLHGSKTKKQRYHPPSSRLPFFLFQ